MQEKITLIGAGLSGSLLAILLAKRGFEVEIFERRPDRRKVSVDAGRSINLAVSARGIHALTTVGVIDQIRQIATPMYGRMNHPIKGAPVGTMYSINPLHSLYSVSRPKLNEILMTEAEKYGVSIHFNQKCEDIDTDNGMLTLMDTSTDEYRTYKHPANRIIACDGANSAIRNAMKRLPSFTYDEFEFKVNYKELCIPADSAGNMQMEREWLHIWGREGGEFMMIALPNKDNTFTCTMFMPTQGERSMAKIDTPEKLHAFFAQYFPDTLPLMPGLEHDYFHNPTSSLNIVMCYPWVIGDKMALVGDACHAVVPFYGQGVNASFEDCLELDRCIGESYPYWGEIFDKYQHRRKANADAISQMAQENFENMSTSGFPAPMLKRHIELEMEKRFPDYKAQYELVSFSIKPYVEAQRRGKLNELVLNEIVQSQALIQAKGIERAVQEDGIATLVAQIDWGQAYHLFRKIYAEQAGDLDLGTQQDDNSSPVGATS